MGGLGEGQFHRCYREAEKQAAKQPRVVENRPGERQDTADTRVRVTGSQHRAPWQDLKSVVVTVGQWTGSQERHERVLSYLQNVQDIKRSRRAFLNQHRWDWSP